MITENSNPGPCTCHLTLEPRLACLKKVLSVIRLSLVTRCWCFKSRAVLLHGIEKSTQSTIAIIQSFICEWVMEWISRLMERCPTCLIWLVQSMVIIYIVAIHGLNRGHNMSKRQKHVISYSRIWRDLRLSGCDIFSLTPKRVQEMHWRLGVKSCREMARLAWG